MDWQKEIEEYLERKVIPSNKKLVVQLKTKATKFTLINGAIYKKGFMQPLSKCI